MFGIDDALVALAGAAGSAGGDIAGNLLGTAYGAHVSRDLMSRQETINRELWRESLLDGPNLQRKGLENAGYNPILALSGFNVPQMSGVSIPSVSSGGISGIGSNMVGTAKEAMKAYSAVKNTNSDTELKDAQKKVADKEVEVKQAQKENLNSQTNLNNAKENQTKVETVTEPLRLAKDVAIGAGTAYGAHKISQKVAEIQANKLPSLTKAQKELKAEQIRRTKTLKGWNDALLKRYHKPTQAFEALKNFGLLALPAAIGAFGSAYGTHKVMQHNKGSHWTDKHGIERNPAWIYGGVPIVP